jgi:hypothetical protein
MRGHLEAMRRARKGCQDPPREREMVEVVVLGLVPAADCGPRRPRGSSAGIRPPRATTPTTTFPPAASFTTGMVRMR